MSNSVAGTTPPGTQSEQQAASWVQQMFAAIAPRYDLLNHLLSLNIDRGWRKALTRQLAPILARPEAKILDLCCGTGDVMFEFKKSSHAMVMGADFCHPMLIAAARKSSRQAGAPYLIEADALGLPLADESLDAISIAFGFRNLSNYACGLRELYRVLKPGGTLAILEFSHPAGRLTKTAYRIYSGVLLPMAGRIISGSREAYSYLPESIRKFPRAEELRRMMEQAGFWETRFVLLSGGIAALHSGVRSTAGAGSAAAAAF